MIFGRKLFYDFTGLFKVVGPYLAIKWMVIIFLQLPLILKKKNLQPADGRMRRGPFHVTFRQDVDFNIYGLGAFSGIREIYVRDVYLGHGLLTINDGDVVVDLGANMGNFTNLALAHGKSVKVISVEPGLVLNETYKRSVSLNNGFIERTSLVRAFIGKMGAVQKAMLTDAQYKGAEWISEDHFINSNNISRIDFLKCDIEGGEFDLLTSDSKLLKMARKIGIEIHSFAGDVDDFIEMLVRQGFTLKTIQRDPDGSATVTGVRNGTLP